MDNHDVELQRAYEQGVKDTLDKYDESCRIASYLRVGMGCETAKDCWELIRKGEIQRVKHGKWIHVMRSGFKNYYLCSECRRSIADYEAPALITTVYPYCHCGAKMDEVVV